MDRCGGNEVRRPSAQRTHSSTFRPSHLSKDWSYRVMVEIGLTVRVRVGLKFRFGFGVLVRLLVDFPNSDSSQPSSWSCLNSTTDLRFSAG